MTYVGALRELETWTAGNIVGGLILLAALVGGLTYAIVRFLRS